MVRRPSKFNIVYSKVYDICGNIFDMADLVFWNTACSATYRRIPIVTPCLEPNIANSIFLFVLISARRPIATRSNTSVKLTIRRVLFYELAQPMGRHFK